MDAGCCGEDKLNKYWERSKERDEVDQKEEDEHGKSV